MLLLRPPDVVEVAERVLGLESLSPSRDGRHLAMTAAIRKVLWETPEKFDPRDYLKPARDAMKKICVERMIAFGHLVQSRPKGKA